MAGICCDMCNKMIIENLAVVRADFLVFCNDVCANDWVKARIDEENSEDERERGGGS